MTGWKILTALGSAVTMAGNLWHARIVRREQGRWPAAITLAILTASLAAYLAVCIFISPGFAGQFLGAVAAAIVLVVFRKHIALPDFARFLLTIGKHDEEDGQ